MCLLSYVLLSIHKNHQGFFPFIACCEVVVCHFTTPLSTWASPRLCGCWFSWCAPSTTVPPAGFAAQGSPLSVPHCGCWELFPPVSTAGPCSGDWTRKWWHQTSLLYNFHSSHQLQPVLHVACKHHAQESRSLWGFYFSSRWNLTCQPKKATKTCCSHRQGPFIVLFSSSALLGVSISESDATWFPFTLVIWLLITNFETKCWVNMPVAQMHTHTNMWHAHTHPCTHPHPYTLTKRLCPCWMFLAVFGVETFQSGHMTCAHPSAHRDPQQWLSTLQGVTKGSEGWRKQRERRVKATRGEKNEGNKGREEQRG